MSPYGVIDGQPILSCERIRNWRLIVYRYHGVELVYRAERQNARGQFVRCSADALPDSIAKIGTAMVKKTVDWEAPSRVYR